MGSKKPCTDEKRNPLRTRLNSEGFMTPTISYLRKTQPSDMNSTMTPEYVLRNFKKHLTTHEEQEIKNYKEVWYIGKKAKKIDASKTRQSNSGYDTKEGIYKAILNDHLAYRYQILEVLGEGYSGQILKCMDHRTKHLVAIKIIRNNDIVHEVAMPVKAILKAVQQFDKDNSANIIQMKNTIYFRSHLCIIFDLFVKDQHDLNYSNESQTTEEGLKNYTMDLLNCLQLLKEKSVPGDHKSTTFPTKGERTVQSPKTNSNERVRHLKPIVLLSIPKVSQKTEGDLSHKQQSTLPMGKQKCPLGPSSHSPTVEKPAVTFLQTTESVRCTSSVIKPTMSPEFVLENLKGYLTSYEQQEIRNYKEVWYIGKKAKKIDASKTRQSNSGYDTKEGIYKAFVNDHLAYRYQILDLLGEGYFGQILKCKDHKTDKLVAIKVIRNKDNVHRTVLPEVKMLKALRDFDKENSANIVHMKEKFYFRRHLCIIFDLYLKDQHDLNYSNESQTTEEELKNYTMNLLNGLQLLKEKSVLGDHKSTTFPTKGERTVQNPKTNANERVRHFKPIVLLSIPKGSQKTEGDLSHKQQFTLPMGKQKCPLGPSSHSPTVEKPAVTFLQTTESVRCTSSGIKPTMSPEFVLENLKEYLTNYEQQEIKDYKEVWYIGKKAKKIDASKTRQSNSGYDTKEGIYKAFVNDHLAYRYQILDLLGEGYSGQILKCKDHKTDLLVAIKVIRNKDNVHEVALPVKVILKAVQQFDKDNSANNVHMKNIIYFRRHLCIIFDLFIKDQHDLNYSNESQTTEEGLKNYTMDLLNCLQLLKEKSFRGDLKSTTFPTKGERTVQNPKTNAKERVRHFKPIVLLSIPKVSQKTERDLSHKQQSTQPMGKQKCPLGPSSHSPTVEKPAGPSSQTTESVRCTSSGIEPTMSPEFVLKNLKAYLTNYEQQEIKNYKEVWYIGKKAKKIDASKTRQSNSGYDTKEGIYKAFVNDHLAYRYQILDLLDEGYSGQILKCKDHKTDQLVAIKVIRNKDNVHRTVLPEVKMLKALRDFDKDNSANIVHMKEKFYFRRHLCIIFDLFVKDQHDLNYSNESQTREEELKNYTMDLLNGLQLLKEKSVPGDHKSTTFPTKGERTVQNPKTNANERVRHFKPIVLLSIPKGSQKTERDLSHKQQSTLPMGKQKFPLGPSSHSPTVEKPAVTFLQTTESVRCTSSVIKPTMSPEFVLKNLKAYLTNYEQQEIKNYKEVWYIGKKAKKMNPSKTRQPNSGYDTKEGIYKAFVNDHLAYRYQILDLLGEGYSGQILKCKDHKTDQLVAIKVIRNKDKVHQTVLPEVKMLKALRDFDKDNSANIVHMKEKFYFRRHLCITFDLYLQDLHVLRYDDKVQFTERELKQYTMEILKCLQLLDEQKIVHGDLKPENLLVYKKNDEMHTAVTDFGGSYFITEEDKPRVFTKEYMSPELLLGKKCGPATDMWSLGCIIAELHCGSRLFNGCNYPNIFNRIMEVLGKPPPELLREAPKRNLFFDSDGIPLMRCCRTTLETTLNTADVKFINFIERCLEYDPKNRMTATQALQHPWIHDE